MSEVKTYRIEEIMNMLPHRYPFLLVDRHNFFNAVSLNFRHCYVD